MPHSSSPHPPADAPAAAQARAHAASPSALPHASPQSSIHPARAMADPMPPAASLPRDERDQSFASSRREDSAGHERPSPMASNGTPAADKKEDDKKEPPTLDWSQFNATFTVKHHAFPRDTARPGKKRKRGRVRKPLLEEDAFDESLQTLYTVEPAKWWDDTRRYRKFTIANESFRSGDAVYVKPAADEAPEGPLESWVAKVLEVRAASEQHVFLRVFWMYRPEDLPGGRRPYHGANEVIASNRMQIIDALTVNGKADLKHWAEDDDGDVLGADQLFWRQTFDWANGKGTGTLSVRIYLQHPTGERLMRAIPVSPQTLRRRGAIQPRLGPYSLRLV
ncbi:hypothetical protein BK809_0007585 [Diplodia seriata]|uniref:BAH domain-containing protein n=1 Tax=Diplodia seriata TaxID=420778 RepID=A0A1S8BJR9_9PEZI|nr:hypothetical protein BK809_0007585 [Diplodia seriata]